MRNNKARWQFFNNDYKNPLSAQEVRYWKTALQKLLKIGIEFELNLQNKDGMCKGDNTACTCSKMITNCWTICEKLKKCNITPHRDTCVNYTEEECDDKSCEDCEQYNLLCPEIACVDFRSVCFTCTDFVRDCDTCDRKWEPEKDPIHSRSVICNTLEPSNTYGSVAKSGVVSVKEDGSLSGNGGVEVITVGRRIDFWEFYTMSKNVLDVVTKNGGFINERCSNHMHLLTSYYNSNEGGSLINEMEKAMPSLIMENFHQLCRRYQNPITWLTMALSAPNSMTRWEKFRVSVLETSPAARGMEGVLSDIRNVTKEANSKSKYGWVNYDNLMLNRSGDVRLFHIEMRTSDAMLLPSAISAIACLYYALVIKSVEISRYGLLKVGDENWLDKAKEVKEAMLNNCSDYNANRVSNTSELMQHRDYLTTESLGMISNLKSILIGLDPAYIVLEKMIHNPIALQRCEGCSWGEIESSLEVLLNKEDQLTSKVSEVIDLKIIEDCRDVDMWIRNVVNHLNEAGDDGISIDTVKECTDIKFREGEVIWSKSLGSVIAL